MSRCTSKQAGHGILPVREENGTVHLVAAGAGDPKLLMLRAARMLGDADAERIYVGKKKFRHAASHVQTNALLTNWWFFDLRQRFQNLADIPPFNCFLARYSC